MLIRLIIFFLLIYLIYRIIKSFNRTRLDRNINKNKTKSMPISGEDLVEDPVCHIYFPVSQAYKKEIAGKIHYFCSKECYELFLSKKSNERQ